MYRTKSIASLTVHICLSGGVARIVLRIRVNATRMACGCSLNIGLERVWEGVVPPQQKMMECP